MASPSPFARFPAALLLALTASCGGEPEPYVPPVGAPIVLDALADVSLFEGQQALFVVRSSGRALTYRWTRDGVPIAGATDSHYLVPPTTLADDGAVFEVEVTAQGVAKNRSRAGLAVHPPLDLRFKWVDSPIPLRGGNLTYASFGIGLRGEGVAGPAITGDVCEPYQGGYFCQYAVGRYVAPPGHRFGLTPGYLDQLDAWLASLPANTIITSLDVEAGPGWFWATTLETEQVGTFALHSGRVPAADLAAAVEAEAMAGRVVTAASQEATQVRYVAYGWSEAPGAALETAVRTATLESVAEAAHELAAVGYVVTALGAGDDGAGGVILVGTRRVGDVTPREVVSQNVGIEGVWLPEGHAPVGLVFGPTGTVALFER